MVRSASTFALVFLFLSCARPALRAPAEPVYTESYPAVAWQEVGKEENDSLKLAWYGGPAPTGEEVDKGTAKTTEVVYWKGSAAHPLLDSLLPGTRCYHAYERSLLSTSGRGWHNAVILYQGRFYRLDRLNYLLRDAGFKFDTTEMADITRIAVLFTLADKQAKRHQTFGGYGPPRDWVKPDSADAATAFPAVKFGEVALAEGKHPVPGMRPEGVKPECAVDGVRSEYWLWLDPQKPWLLYEADRKLVNFTIPRSRPAPDPEPR